jgi:DNA-binding CsgD family transcriptional regulator
MVHGLYWLAANLAARQPLVMAIDDAHLADDLSQRWLAYLVPRLGGLPLTLLVALRASDPALTPAPLQVLRTYAATILRPELLSQSAVTTLVRDRSGAGASDQFCAAMYDASGGNPLYVDELLRGLDRQAPQPQALKLPPSGVEEIARHIVTRVRGFDPRALGLGQAMAVLGDGCELRHAARIAEMHPAVASEIAQGLVRLEVLESDAPPRFLHPVIREALESSMGSHERNAAHLSAAHLLYADGAHAGHVGAHLLATRPAGDSWVTARLEEAADVALDSGTPRAAARLLGRALAEPPPARERIRLLRAAARAEASSGLEAACEHLEEALRLEPDPLCRAEVALEIGEVYASLFRWVDAVDVIQRTLVELGDEADESLAGRLEGELVVAGLHDARRAAQVRPVLARLANRHQDASDEALAVAQGMVRFLSGEPADEIAVPLEQTLQRAGPQAANWNTRAALLWVLVGTERLATVEHSLELHLAEVHRSGSARGLVAVYSTLGLLKLRLGALPEADAAARVALQVLQEGDFTPGLVFAATVLADVAMEAGEYAEAQTLLDLLPQAGWPAGVGSVLIPAARGRLRLAQGRPAEALADFESCMALLDADVWGMPIREVGYVHARSGAVLALVRLGPRQRACELAEAELEDARVFGGARALGVALRAAGLARGGDDGLGLMRESAEVLANSPALLERAHTLVELGAALRRSGQRAAARDPLEQALELAARCGARPLAARAREELNATGARPRREWRTGVEALTPSELRVVRLAVDGLSNREIAQELYVTLKTVEGHLARAYAKLGIDGRGQLASALSGEKTRVATL